MEELKTTEAEFISRVPKGAIFRHYKGREYKILHLGRREEDCALCVVYQGLYACDTFGNYPIWIRPLDNFLQEVEVGGKRVPRFSLTHQPI